MKNLINAANNILTGTLNPTLTTYSESVDRMANFDHVNVVVAVVVVVFVAVVVVVAVVVALFRFQFSFTLKLRLGSLALQ